MWVSIEFIFTCELLKIDYYMSNYTLLVAIFPKFRTNLLFHAKLTTTLNKLIKISAIIVT
jgi:hypothetical protein